MANFLRQIVIDRISANEGETKQLTLISKAADCIIGSAQCKATLYEIVYANEMYSPSHLTVKFNIVPAVQKSPLPTYQEVVKFFLLSTVTIKRLKQTDETTGAAGTTEILETIDSNYYVHEVRPTYVNSGPKDNIETKIVVSLDIYSADKLMTLDSYSKSYVHKSLYGDIIAAETAKFKIEGGVSVSTKDLSTRLKFKSSQNGEEKEVEIVHPYLVQYNEPFYDLLARTANRMGEFLYFADGNLTLGTKVDTSTTAPEIKDYASFAVDSCNNSVLKTIGISRRYTGTKHDKSSENRHYTQPTSNDDYLLLYKKGGFDNLGNEFLAWRLIPMAFKTLFNTSSIGGFIAEYLIGQGKELGWSAYYASATNDKYYESAIKNAPGNVDDTKAVLSGTYQETYFNDWYANIKTEFYNKIDECEKKMASRTVTITLKGDDTVNYQVGQIVMVSNIKYVITKVKYSEIFDGRSMRYEYILQALPLLNVKPDKNTHEATLMLRDDIASSDGGGIDICCPMPLSEEHRIRKASPQTAWVVENEDPKFMGRVRIRYAWDSADADASPWIRQAEPAAGKGGGFSFRLYKNDEVMIGYENDNIEQPFVIGALYHGKDDEKDIPNGAPVGRNKYIPFTHVLSNKSGHKMILSEKKNSATFFAGMQPGLAYFGNMMKDAYGESKDATLAGGIQFTDKYGIYNVQMSSDQRLISIASPLGNIKLSAFSGISISAPRGNISISGKNVSIKAANKLTIESGENAKNTEFGRTWHDKNAGWAILDATLQSGLGGISDTITSFVDMSMVRTIVECFTAPVDGTLQIKSNRYLLLEAGLGSAMIPQDGFQDANIAEKDLGGYNKYYGGSNKALKMKLQIEKLVGMVDSTAQYWTLLKNVKEKVETYDAVRHPDRHPKDYYKETDAAYGILKDGSYNENTAVSAIVENAGALDLGERDIAIENAGKALCNAINELKKFVKSYKKENNHWTYVSYHKDTDFGVAFTKAEHTFKQLFDLVILVPAESNTIVKALDDYYNLVAKKQPMSNILFAYLTALRDLGTTSILEQDPKINNVPSRESEWESFFENLKFHTPEGHTAEKLWGEGTDKFINNLKKNLGNLNPLLTYRENSNWGYDRAKHGRILFSDQGGNTYFVDSKNKNIESNPNPNLSMIKEQIKQIFKNEQMLNPD